MGVFATKSFKAGSVIYDGRFIVIPNKYDEFTLVSSQGTFLLDTETHSVQFSETQRWLFLYDSFMNHSCDPTSISKMSPEQREKSSYTMIALRDIFPGDEITCTY